MLLMIDNYDSFTYNLVQYFGELGEDVRVARNDEITLEEIAALAPDRICISPGPCSPTEAGISIPVLERFSGKVPILGVCLGHQAIGQAFGGRVIRAQALMHGKTGLIHHTGVGVFAGLPDPFTCPPASRSPHGPTMARSWGCATRRCRLKACSSIRSRSRPSTVTTC
jgi:anthranilate synthase component 2